MDLPLPSVMPEAVRNSVSIRSFSTVTRDGMSDLSSFSVAARHLWSLVWPNPAEAESSSSSSSGVRKRLIMFFVSRIRDNQAKACGDESLCSTESCADSIKRVAGTIFHKTAPVIKPEADESLYLWL